MLRDPLLVSSTAASRIKLGLFGTTQVIIEHEYAICRNAHNRCRGSRCWKSEEEVVLGGSPSREEVCKAPHGGPAPSIVETLLLYHEKNKLSL